MQCDSLLVVTTDDITRHKDILARHLGIPVENFSPLAVTMTEGPADDDYEAPEDSHYFKEARRVLVRLANEHNRRVLPATDAARLEYILSEGHDGASTSGGGASGEEVDRLLSEREEMQDIIFGLREENAELLRRAQEGQQQEVAPMAEASSTATWGGTWGGTWG